MDYKEKYEQALERAKVINPGTADYEVAVKIFPELKESEDERMRNFINNELAFLRALDSIDSDRYKEITNAIAWLEKQGHDGKMWIYRDVYLKEKEQLVQDGIDDVLQHPQKYGLEKQGNRKSVDNVEPKFKVGDWITNGACTIQTTSVDDTYYWHDNDCIGGDIESMDKEYHLWTIQDAKDGDVLADGDLPFIFKKIDAYNYIYAYCGISLSGNFRIESDGELGEWTWMLDIKPATKEQRDLLLQKMKEAGYEWDAEKKELKKIEQKPTWSDEDEKERKRVVGLLEGWLSTFTETCYAEDCKCGIAWLKSLKQRMKGETK